MENCICVADADAASVRVTLLELVAACPKLMEKPEIVGYGF